MLGYRKVTASDIIKQNDSGKIPFKDLI